jgi:regulator of sigma E protease
VKAINGQPVTDSEAVTGLLAATPSQPITLTVLRKETNTEETITVTPAANIVPKQAIMVAEIVQGAPADGVFEVGDVIINFNGKPINLTATIQEEAKEFGDMLIKVTVRRNGEDTVLEITPRKTPPANEGPMGISLVEIKYDVVYGLGVVDATNSAIKQYGLGDAISYALDRTRSVLTQLVSFPARLINREVSGEQARPVSVVGISQMGGQLLRNTVEDRQPHWILSFTALISLALGFTNLLPIPGLDGGRILFVLIEIVRGKPVRPEFENRIHYVGLLILLGLFAIVMVNDLINPIILP